MNPPVTALCQSATLRRLEARHAGEPLMERAGLAAAELAVRLCGERNDPLLVLAGPGNNGGDALVLARLLRERFFDVRVVFGGEPDRLPADAAQACARFLAAGGTLLNDIPDIPRWALIVDGLFGIGLKRAPAGRHADWIVAANRLVGRDACPLLALDNPSGLDADTGVALTPCIVASHTISFISGKPGLLTADGPDHAGEIHVATLDVAPDDRLPADGRIITPAAFADWLKPRRRNSHKGSFGSVGVLGGGRGMAGAALLAARAALKLGAGRVYLGLLDPDAPTLDPLQPELMIRRADQLFQADLQALVCGPGLGRSGDADLFVDKALKAPLPLVLDADALNILAVDSRLEGNLVNRVAPALLTPHPAEAARLLGVSTVDVQRDRISAASELAGRYACGVALKGCGTVIAQADGRWAINTTGNPGMATAGMGDVLSGLTGALLAQGWPAEAALDCAVHLHGAAADRRVADGSGPIGLTAGEIAEAARTLFNAWIAGAR